MNQQIMNRIGELSSLIKNLSMTTNFESVRTLISHYTKEMETLTAQLEQNNRV